MWGFSFNKQGASNNTFHPIPSNAIGTKIGSTEVPNTAEDIYNIVLGARIDNSLATGTYSNTFIVVASANPVPYKVKYDPNADSDQVSGMPGNNTSATTSTQTFALPSEEPKRSGYEFIGWCDKTTTEETGVDICQNGGHSYQASDTYTLKARDEDITFYAMWASNDHIMQNWKGCATATKNEQITLVDIRDNRPYYVAKLADNNCWMTENLDYDIVANTPLTSETTDLGYAEQEDITECGYECTDDRGNYKWIPDSATYTSKTLSNWTVGDTYLQQSYDPGNLCWSGNIDPRELGLKLNPADGEMVQTCDMHDKSHYHLGNYYSFGAAVAQNSTKYKQNNGDTYNTSVCPAGWRLPVLSGDASYKNLFDAAEQNNAPVTSGISGNIQVAPYYFTYTGYVGGSSGVAGFNDRGHYWTNMRNTQIISYNLRIRAGISTPGSQDTSGGVVHGFSVRCLARK